MASRGVFIVLASACRASQRFSPSYSNSIRILAIPPKKELVMLQGYTIDMKGRRIFEVKEVSRRFVCNLSESDFKKLVAEKKPRLFLWAMHDRLTELPQEWPESLLPGQICSHPDEIELEKCPTGCCYVAMHWKGDHGAPIVVMWQFH